MNAVPAESRRGAGSRRVSAERVSGLTPASKVLAVVPHYRCEEWLGDCLEALASQTRRLEAIVVVDDASAHPPVEIVRRFPEVTLLAAERNGGPYRLVQEVIDRTDYDAYLFNDADDWSREDRLEILLGAAATTGAELVGSQEVRILCEQAEVLTFSYPLDVNAALRQDPSGFPLLHPSSLVGRALVRRIGGFATGLRYSGDLEFLYRAAHAARIVNVPAYCYYRRERPGALTTSPDTGLDSAARRELHEAIWARARQNARRAANGDPPDLRPLRAGAGVRLRHLAGPWLRGLTLSPRRPVGIGVAGPALRAEVSA